MKYLWFGILLIAGCRDSPAPPTFYYGDSVLISSTSKQNVNKCVGIVVDMKCDLNNWTYDVLVRDKKFNRHESQMELLHRFNWDFKPPTDEEVQSEVKDEFFESK